MLDKVKLENIALSRELQEKGSKNEESEFFVSENIKLKKINSELL